MQLQRTHPPARGRSDRRLRQGTTAIEYGLVAAMVATACVLGYLALGDALKGNFETTTVAVEEALE